MFFLLIPTSQIAVFWYPSAFNPIRVYDLKNHTDFGKKKMTTLQNRLHDKFQLYMFLTFIGFEYHIYQNFTASTIKCIHAAITMLRRL